MTITSTLIKLAKIKKKNLKLQTDFGLYSICQDLQVAPQTGEPRVLQVKDMPSLPTLCLKTFLQKKKKIHAEFI